MYECVATTAFGIEAVMKRELISLGFETGAVRNGRVYFKADAAGIMRANLNLRTAEHIFVVLGKKTVRDFDALFDFVKALNLKNLIDPEGQFIVNAQSQKSALFSLRDIQKITKKALIENLRAVTGTFQFTEAGARHDFLMYILDDEAEFLLDTSGNALHKRGYRASTGVAPLKETLAAALILLSFYDKDRPLIDPFCGSGTIAIEAAMIAKNIAPGLNRRFAFEHFPWCDRETFRAIKREALKAIDQTATLDIRASDIDHGMVETAKENAFNAGVDEDIRFKTADFIHVDYEANHAVMITNPPYGKRIEDEKTLAPLYRRIGRIIHAHDTYSFYILTPFSGFEKTVGKKASKTRVLYNGNIKTRFYQYFGPRPGRS